MLSNKGKSAALYVRVSTDEQAQKGTSMETQEKDLLEYCRREGIVVHDVYKDDGYSGSSLDRPEIQRLLRDAKSGAFGIVLVAKLDRLSRSMFDTVTIVLGDLEQSGVQFKSISEFFSTSDPVGKMLFAILAMFADFERDRIRTRCIEGRKARNREGRYTGGPLPYSVGWSKEKSEFTQVADEASIYRRMFALLFEKPTGYSEIARILNKDGCRTREGKEFTARHVIDLLRSEVAGGIWIRNRVKEVKTKDPIHQRNLANGNYRKQGMRPEEEWIKVPVPAVISPERWKMAQEIMDSRLKPRHPIGNNGLCNGILFCECGSRMGLVGFRKGADGQEFGDYICYAVRYRKDSRYPAYKNSACRMPRFKNTQVDDLVWFEIERLITEPGILWDVVHGEDDDSKREELERRAKDARRRLTDARHREERVSRLFAMGVDARVQEKEVREAASLRKAFEKEVIEAERALTTTKMDKDLQKTAFDALMSLKGRLGDLTLEKKRQILRSLVPGGQTHRVELTREGQIVIRGVIDIDALHPHTVGPYPTPRYET